MRFDKPIIIEKKDEKTEKWGEFLKIHARVNKAKTGTTSNEYLNAGAVRSQNTLTFEVRYTNLLEEIRLNTQFYRIIYRGYRYNVTDYDDYLEKHQTIKLLGVSY